MFNRKRLAAAVSAAFGAGLIAVTPTTSLAQSQMDRVEITGSSIKRIEGETALPVQILTREDIQRTGASNVEQLMQTVSANMSSGQLIGASASGATTLGLSGLSLRGLNSTRTLVLINGRRVSPYGYGFTNDSVSVDVNAIPLDAIERVEILKDGASAIYGSDAIAGVVNFILRKDFKGVELSAEYGEARNGSAPSARASIAWGMGDLAKDRYNVMIVGSYSKEKALFGRDRAFASSGINENALNDTTSGNTFPGNIAAADGSFGSRNPSAPTCPGPYSQLDPLFPPDRCRFDPSPMVSLFPDATRYGVFTSGKFDITPTMQLFGEASYYRNETNVVIQPTPISDQFTIPLNNPLANQFPYNAFVGGLPVPGGGTSPIPYSTILLTSASPFYPTAYVQGLTGGATPDLLVRWRANLTGNRDLTDTSQATRFVGGLRGTAGTWDYEGSLLYSASKVTEKVNDGFAIISQTLPILNSGNVDFFGNGTSAATLAALEAAEFHGQTLKTQTSLTSLNGKASSDIGTLAGGPLSVALGGEVRQETYKLDPASVMVQGDLTGYGGNFVPVDKDRTVYAAFAEINARVLPTLELNGALRFDHYGGVGSSTTPKIGLRYQPVKEVLLRGSAGRGFRAPSLLDLHAPATTGVTPPGLSDPDRCVNDPADPRAANPNVTLGNGLDCVTQFPITNGGNPNLKPEKSRNLTAGILLEPTNNVSMAFDYFWISLKDTINNGIPAAIILSDTVKYASLITRGAPLNDGLPGPIVDINQTNLNTGRTDLSGWDIDLRFSTGATPYGRFTLAGNGTYLSKYDVQNPDLSYTTALDTANNNTGGVVVRWKHFATLTWQAGAWTTVFSQSYQKRYTDLPGTFEDTDPTIFIPRKVNAYDIYGLQTAYAGWKGLTLTFGIRNLFDTPPPYTNAGGQTSFQAGYDPTYGDPRGRFFYGRVQYKFL
jgi:iron complex outermembrane receptor protein